MDKKLRGKNSHSIVSFARSFFQLTALIIVWSIGGETVFCLEESTGLSVVVKQQAWVHGDKVYLKDIAELKGSAEFQQKFGRTFLALSPRPGKSKTLTGSWIAAKIRSAGQVSTDVAYEIPNYVRVGRNYQLLDEVTLEQYYVDYIAQRLKGRDADFRVTRFRVTGNGPLPEGKMRVELVPQREKKLVGNVSLNARIWVENNVERHLVLSGWIDRFEEVVCVYTPLMRHAVITEQDLFLECRNVAKLSDNLVRNVQAAVGKRVKHSVRAGDVLTTRAIEDPPIIKKGDRVTIMAESPSLTITTLGIAQGKGFYGDVIRVKNLTSNKDVFASVVDSSTVRVGF